MRYLLLSLSILFTATFVKGQAGDCVFKKPLLTIHFGSGNVTELNTEMPYHYRRVSSSCPTDGHYTYTSYTSECFSSDWHTIAEDHTPGDAGGNMMLVNASPNSGTFLTTTIIGLKGNTYYEFSVWMMNVCKISDKCPFPLLPDITIRLQTTDGKMVAQFGTGELARREAPHWTQYRAMFTTPASQSPLTLTMLDNNPGGCGNDFALDDISFRECEKPVPVTTVKPTTPVVTKPPTKTPVAVKQQPKVPPVIKQQPAPQVVVKTENKTPKPVVKKETPERRLQTSRIGKVEPDSSAATVSTSRPGPRPFPLPPPVLVTRANPLIKKIETEAGEIRLDLYDNGQVDGDTVTIYHNNRLLMSKVRLSEKAITFRIAIDPEHPHHELIMVAENLGSIPPNTSLMIITAGNKRHDVFISSTEQKNAKIVIDLK